MKTKIILRGLTMAVVLQLGVLAGSAQTNIYLFSGSKTNITLPPGTYIITAYGAPGGGSIFFESYGAKMSAEFNFSTSTNLILLVGGGGGGSYPDGCGGGGGSFVVESNTPLVIAGGSGGSAGGPGGSGFPDFPGSNSGGAIGGAGGVGQQVVITVSPVGVGGGGGGGGFLGNGGDGVGGDRFYSTGGGGGSSFTGGGGGGAGGNGYGYANGFSGGYGGGGGGGGGNSGCGGGGGGYQGGGGGNGFEGGEGGHSIIDSSAIMNLTDLFGSGSPDDPNNGEIIITAVPTPLLITTGAAFGFTNGAFGFNVTGPAGSNVVIQASTDLQTWIPLQTTLLGSGPFYFSDPQSPTNVQRFYRAAYAFTVGGTLTGLPAGDTVTLQDNGGDNLTLSNNGTFTFPTALPNGQSYSVTVSRTSGGSILTETIRTLMNGSGTISGANVTNVAVQCTPLYTGDPDVDMYNAAVADGTANGGVPAVMYTEHGGPFRVTAEGIISSIVCQIYQGWSTTATTIGNTSCSSTTFPSNTGVIQFGTALVCGGQDFYGY